MPPPFLHTEAQRTPDPPSEDGWDKFAFYQAVKEVVSDDEIEDLKAKHGSDLALAVDEFKKGRSKSMEDDNLPSSAGDDAVKEEATSSDAPQMLCYRDQVYDRQRRKFILKRPHSKSRISERFERYVLLIRRVYSVDHQTYAFTIVEVKGAHLRSYLCKIFRGVDGFPLTGKKFELNEQRDELHFLFWARRELLLLLDHLSSPHGSSATDSIQAKFEIEAALQFISEEWGSMMPALDEMIAAKTISFEYLWAILPPGSLVVATDLLEHQRVYRLNAAKVEVDQTGNKSLKIAASYADFSHRTLGHVATVLSIPAFSGQVDIMDLPVVPFRHHSDTAGLQEEILERTSQQLSFFGEAPKVQQHQGRQDYGAIGLTEVNDKLVRFNKESWEAVLAKLLQNSAGDTDMTRETVMREIHDGLRPPEPFGGMPGDLHRGTRPPGFFRRGSSGLYGGAGAPRSFRRLSSDYSSSTDTPTLDNTLKTRSKLPLADVRSLLTLEQKLMFPGHVYGYSLGDEKWGAFSVSRVVDVEWNTPLLKSLVMEEDLKEMLKDLIETHAKESSPFDDFVWGKGKGLVGLLSGPPGSGKTLTAEAIAETAHMPLYTVSSGSLGSTAGSVSRGLSRNLRLASHWNAVLLLDEADVFLAERSIQDLERNAIVSVFLRELEYYTGILILTTNLPDIIDEAVENRIHFFHHYQSLDENAREQVWRNFVTSIKDSLDIEIEDNDYTELARLGLNGRQIKNVMSISVKLAMATNDKVLRTDRIIRTAKTLQKPRPPVKPKPSRLVEFAPRRS